VVTDPCQMKCSTYSLSLMLIMMFMQLDRDLQGSLEKLFSICTDKFWHKGHILVQVEHQMVLIVDGNIVERKVMDPFSQPYIQSVRPLAIVAGQETKISFKGFNLAHSGTRQV
jgi:hypothetical protein